MRFHLLGVCGAGMAPLAGILKESGHAVSGSDAAYLPPMSTLLQSLSIECFDNQDVTPIDRLDPSQDTVVVGNVTRRDHPLVARSNERAVRMISMPTALRQFVFDPFDKEVIAICGTHGKTTTTALAAHCLAALDDGTGYFVGGIPRSLPAPYSIGRTQKSLTHRSWFVIEGDEYDSAFFEKVPKMWGYKPKHVVLTSIAHDHIDIYPTIESYDQAFATLIAQLPADGSLVYNAGDPGVVRVIKKVQPLCQAIPYCAYDVANQPFSRASDITPIFDSHAIAPLMPGDPSSFEVFGYGSLVGRFASALWGTHNQSNITGMLALLIGVFGIEPKKVQHALATFAGVRRRIELAIDGKKSAAGITLFDDFAHHPEAVHATLQTLRARFASQRLVAVFEPKSATACRKLHQADYPPAFADADVVYLTPLGRKNLPLGEQLDLQAIARELRAAGKQVHTPDSLDALENLLLENARHGDIVALMSNGSLEHLVSRLVEKWS